MVGRSKNPKWRAYKAQKHSAKRRAIEWLYTFETWCAWWGDDFARRGNAAGCLMMCRQGDAGPYSPENCYKGTPAQNIADASVTCANGQKVRWARYKASGGRCHLADRQTHPRNKPVITPDGQFPSITTAADFYGITRQAMFQKISRLGQFRYA